MNIELVNQALATIKDQELVEFVIDFLNNEVASAFWKAPSSSSGKYHPPEDQGEGGLFRHTIKALQVAIDLCRLYKINENDTDIVKAAILLHDSYKNCDRISRFSWGNRTNYKHGKIAADALRKEANRRIESIYKTGISQKTYKKVMVVAKLVEIHMGQWAKPKPYYNIFRKRLEQIVIEADYISSRKGISFTIKKILEK